LFILSEASKVAEEEIVNSEQRSMYLFCKHNALVWLFEESIIFQISVVKLQHLVVLTTKRMFSLLFF
jgi:hypothetical protein